MGKIFGILMLVVSLWIGMEIYQNGMEGALGGRLAFVGDSDGPENVERRTVPQRAGDAARRAQNFREERRNRLLDE